LPPVGKQPEPVNLCRLKEEISRRWGVIDLLNVIKDVDHVTGFTGDFISVASRTVTDPAVLQHRLLLCLYGLGTNVGIKRVADGVAAVDPVLADTEAALRRTRRLFINRDNLRGRDPDRGEQDPSGPRHYAVGAGHLVRVGLAQVRIMVGQPHDRVVTAVRRPRDHGDRVHGFVREKGHRMFVSYGTTSPSTE
jgi:hypothetical protein